MKTKKKSNKSV